MLWKPVIRGSRITVELTSGRSPKVSDEKALLQAYPKLSRVKTSTPAPLLRGFARTRGVLCSAFFFLVEGGEGFC